MAIKWSWFMRLTGIATHADVEAAYAQGLSDGAEIPSAMAEFYRKQAEAYRRQIDDALIEGNRHAQAEFPNALKYDAATKDDPFEWDKICWIFGLKP
jgi:hypothetical protein